VSRRHGAPSPTNALGLIRRFHQHPDNLWWDQEFIPHLAAVTASWPLGWREDVNLRRKLVGAAHAYLEGQRGMTEPDTATLVPHALACVANWPYKDRLSPASFTVPVRFFAGLAGFEWCQPEDDTSFLPPIYDRFVEARRNPRGGVWTLQGRRLQMRGRFADPDIDRENARLKDEEGWTHVQIGEYREWPIQRDGFSRRCRSSEASVKRGRRLT